jgi:hypothetical protein
MENIEDRNFVQNKLKSYFLSYLSALILFIIILSSSVVLNNYIASLDSTLNKLYTLKINLVKVRETIKDINNSLDDMGKIMPPGIMEEPSIKYIYRGLDTIKTIVGKAQVTMGAIEDKGNELHLPIIISGMIIDYSFFFNGTGNLQSMKFPFFTIDSLVITGMTGSKGENTFVYEIKGDLNTPKIVSNVMNAEIRTGGK